MFATAQYDETAARIRRPATTIDRNDRELVRLATLAASSHNTQPWTFEVSPGEITIRTDLRRRCEVVDPDDAHLFKSLGCAAENLVHAATTQALDAIVEYDPADRAVVVRLRPSNDGNPSPLARAITTRQCTRGPYDGRPVAADDLARLLQAGDHDAVRCILLTSADQIERVIEDVSRGDRAQLDDPRFRRELVSWIRFNPAAALRAGDGLAGRTTGQPPVPTALARTLQRVLITSSKQAQRDADLLRTSAGVAAFVTTGDDERAWVAAGRAYQRFALQAELLDIRTAFVNQPLEVVELRPGFEHWLGLNGDEHAQLLARFGHGAKLPHSLRRPLDEVIETPSQR